MPKWYSRLEFYITYKFNKCIRKLYTNTFVNDVLVKEVPVTFNFFTKPYNEFINEKYCLIKLFKVFQINDGGLMSKERITSYFMSW